jgi:hypothetical protein
MRKKKKNSASEIMRGLVLPAKWDKNGRAMRISLNTPDEKVYMIDCSGPGKELLKYMREMIEIEGKVFHQLDGTLYVKVKRFKVLSEIQF